MKVFIFVLTISLLALAGCAAMRAEKITSTGVNPEVTPNSVDPTNADRQPILVELFTSEGCSSCPPADKELTFLKEQQPVGQAEVIALAFHVDYWDGPSWRDRFSSASYSQRQADYAQTFNLDSNYTPQMVVDGQAQFVGSNGNDAIRSIMDAVRNKKGSVNAAVNGDKIKVDVSGLPEHDNATLFLAIAEDNISTNVKGGENAGSKLSHSAVVRDLKAIAKIPAGVMEQSVEIELPTGKEWDQKSLNYVIFVQDKGDRKIIAVGKSK